MSVLQSTSLESLAPVRDVVATPKPKRRKPPMIWFGMTLGAWWRLLRAYDYRVAPTRYHKVLFITLFACCNTCLARVQRLALGRRQRRTKLIDDPIFVLGHWRTGTTWLHDLLALDRRHGFPTTCQCIVPEHFLLSEWLLRRLVPWFLPKKRNMDNMPLGMDCPQEEDVALCNLGLPTPYSMPAFPNEAPRDNAYLTLEDAPAAELDRWKRGYWNLLRDVTLACGKRLVLKNPPNTARVSSLLEMFPRAKFVHIIRNPYAIYPSTRNMWKLYCEDNGLQKADCPRLDEYVLDSFVRMYDKFYRDLPNIPSGQYSELRYEDLVADPAGEVSRVYEELGLGDSTDVCRAIDDYMRERSDYQTNNFQLSATDRERVVGRWGKFIERWGYEPPRA